MEETLYRNNKFNPFQSFKSDFTFHAANVLLISIKKIILTLSIKTSGIQNLKKSYRRWQNTVRNSQNALQRDRELLRRSEESLRRAMEPLQRAEEPLRRAEESLQRDGEPLQRAEEPLRRDREPLRSDEEPLRRNAEGFSFFVMLLSDFVIPFSVVGKHLPVFGMPPLLFVELMSIFVTAILVSGQGICTFWETC